MRIKEIGIYPILDDTYLTLKEFASAALKIAASGAKMIQLRVKRHSPQDFLKVAQDVHSILKESVILLIINDRADIALLSGAGGVHLGENDIPVKEVRELMREKIIGFSTHNIEDLKRDFIPLCDYVAFGPIFATKTKESGFSPQGVAMLREFVKKSEKPVVAIGGIGFEHIESVRKTGAAGASMISAILRGDIARNAKEAVKIWRNID